MGERYQWFRRSRVDYEVCDFSKRNFEMVACDTEETADRICRALNLLHATEQAEAATKPEDGAMTWISPKSYTKRTRKAHWCDYCNERINAGDPSVSWLYRDGPVDSCPCRVHPECYDETEKRAAEDGGVFEFVPGENPRPGKDEP